MRTFAGQAAGAEGLSGTLGTLSARPSVPHPVTARIHVPSHCSRHPTVPVGLCPRTLRRRPHRVQTLEVGSPPVALSPNPHGMEMSPSYTSSLFWNDSFIMWPNTPCCRRPSWPWPSKVPDTWPLLLAPACPTRPWTKAQLGCFQQAPPPRHALGPGDHLQRDGTIPRPPSLLPLLHPKPAGFGG